MLPSIRIQIADYLRSTADWRRRRYQDDLRDARNLRSADALEAFAHFLLNLAEDDERLHRLAELAFEGELFVPGQQTAYEIGRLHFFSPDATFDGFLDYLIELAALDRNEHGRFGGRQATGDDPWR